MLSDLFAGIVHNFFVSFGVVIGSCVFAGIGAVLTNKPPLKTMVDLADAVKLWAMAIALGDTFSSYAAIEKGLFQGELKTIIKQGIYVLTALTGANLGCGVIKILQRCGELWNR